jgi:hypothetical protein
MEDTEPKADEKITFLNHMLNFDESTKNELSNISQYSLLAIIPVIALNKLMKKYIPPADDDKGSLEIIFEVTLQMLLLFFGLFYIHRFVSFFKPYSTKSYPEISIISIILAVLLITLSIQSKLGEKANILVERLHDLWNGETTLKPEPKKKPEVVKPKVERPPTQNHHVPQNNPIEQPQQELPNYNMMYHNTATPPQEETQLLAANEAIGGSSFGSMF